MLSMIELSIQAKLLWAKKSMDAESGDLKWLPLYMHMSDAAGIAKMLWDEWLPEKSRLLIESGLEGNGLSNSSARDLVIFLAAAHDIGKATPVFQSKPSRYAYYKHVLSDLDEQILDKVRSSGLVVHDYTLLLSPQKTPHALATQLILEQFGCSRNVAIILGAHHGKPPNEHMLISQSINSFPDNFYLGEKGKAGWQVVQKELTQYALDLSGFCSFDELPKPNMIAQFLLAAIVIMADWIASNEKYFPYIDLNSHLGELIDFSRYLDAWRQLDLPRTRIPKTIDNEHALYSARFGFVPNVMQSAVAKVVRSIKSPGIMIIEAPMGTGKTEAALASAEIFAQKTKTSGLFFALPTQATSNGMFPRLLNWLANLDSKPSTIRLAHSKAQFNHEYRELMMFSGGSNIEDEEGKYLVHSWFEGQKKALLADFVVGTIDQLLFAALRQKHVMLRHLGLSGKVVIIDECHAFDAYMNQYLKRALKWLGAYHVPVIMLSATLPSHSRQQLIEAYMGKTEGENEEENISGEIEKNLQEEQVWSHNRSYPLLTYSDGDTMNCHEIVLPEGSYEVTTEELLDDDLIETLQEHLSSGGCAGIMVNTVRRSQKIANTLRQVFGHDIVRLIHSRFLVTDRIRKEAELMNELGGLSRDGSRPYKRIYVGTQIFEQSLDIDFDVLFTDLCPMDLLLQRMGRMHRHKRIRPLNMKQAKCYILYQKKGEFDRGSSFVYGQYLLMRTKAVLPQTVVIPDDISKLVEQTYGDKDLEILRGESYDDAKEAWASKLKDKKARANVFRIGQPWTDFCQDISGFLDTSIGLTEQHAQAAVRDTNESFEVILLKQEKSGSLKMFSKISDNGDAEPELQPDEVPGDELARQIATQTIVLPHVLCLPKVIDRTIEELEEITMNQVPVWQQSPWLRGELFLIADAEGKTPLNGYCLKYSCDDGLEYEKEDQDV